MAPNSLPERIQALIARWRLRAHESDLDGDFCCAVTREHDAEDLEGLLAVSQASGWQPIETAPKDGTHVVLFGTLWNDPAQQPRSCVSWWCVRREDSPAHALGWFFSAPGYTNGFNPTYWAVAPPSPPGPQEKQEP